MRILLSFISLFLFTPAANQRKSLHNLNFIYKIMFLKMNLNARFFAVWSCADFLISHLRTFLHLEVFYCVLFHPASRTLVNYEYYMMFAYPLWLWLHKKTISQVNNQNLGFALIWFGFLRVCIRQTWKGCSQESSWLYSLFGHMLSGHALFVVLI